MLTVGITGGIGSGKTTVCKVFELFGAAVYYADDKARELMNTDKDLIKTVKSEFGEDMYNDSNLLNKDRMSEIVFNDKGALQKLNSLVHPVVIRDFEQWLASLSGRQYAILESALIVETVLTEKLDIIVTVYSPEELRISRVMERDNVNRDKVISIMKNQSSDDVKLNKSDYIIIDNSEQSVIEQVENLHMELISGKYQ